MVETSRVVVRTTRTERVKVFMRGLRGAPGTVTFPAITIATMPELFAMADGGLLIPGRRYRAPYRPEQSIDHTDSAAAPGVFAVYLGPWEHLILTARSLTDFYDQAESEEFPEHVIHFTRHPYWVVRSDWQEETFDPNRTCGAIKFRWNTGGAPMAASKVEGDFHAAYRRWNNGVDGEYTICEPGAAPDPEDYLDFLMIPDDAALNSAENRISHHWNSSGEAYYPNFTCCHHGAADGNRAYKIKVAKGGELGAAARGGTDINTLCCTSLQLSDTVNDLVCGGSGMAVQILGPVENGRVNQGVTILGGLAGGKIDARIERWRGNLHGSVINAEISGEGNLTKCTVHAEWPENTLIYGDWTRASFGQQIILGDDLYEPVQLLADPGFEEFYRWSLDSGSVEGGQAHCLQADYITEAGILMTVEPGATYLLMGRRSDSASTSITQTIGGVTGVAHVGAGPGFFADKITAADATGPRWDISGTDADGNPVTQSAVLNYICAYKLIP